MKAAKVGTDGLCRRTISYFPGEFPNAEAKILALPHGTLTEYVMNLVGGQKDSEELRLLRQNNEILIKIFDALKAGTLSIPEASERVEEISNDMKHLSGFGMEV